MAENIIDSKELFSDITIEVTIARYNQHKIRYAIGLWLMRMAAWVMWENIVIAEDADD